MNVAYKLIGSFNTTVYHLKLDEFIQKLIEFKNKGADTISISSRNDNNHDIIVRISKELSISEQKNLRLTELKKIIEDANEEIIKLNGDLNITN